jgi:gamma-glutamylcyclotransferase (GGCT)/AIG2-like uncharacterized protein YtfP
MAPSPSCVFVYGTLKRGEQRAPLWPRSPQRVEQAVARGQLHDLGPYPAMVDGTDQILGELWTLAAEDLALTLRELDAIECYDQGGVDLFVRRVIECRTLDGQVHAAHAYFYGQPDKISQTPTAVPAADGYCRWSGSSRGVEDSGDSGGAGSSVDSGSGGRA